MNEQESNAKQNIQNVLTMSISKEIVDMGYEK